MSAGKDVWVFIPPEPKFPKLYFSVFRVTTARLAVTWQDPASWRLDPQPVAEWEERGLWGGGGGAERRVSVPLVSSLGPESQQGRGARRGSQAHRLLPQRAWALGKLLKLFMPRALVKLDGRVTTGWQLHRADVRVKGLGQGGALREHQFSSGSFSSGMFIWGQWAVNADKKIQLYEGRWGWGVVVGPGH